MKTRKKTVWTAIALFIAAALLVLGVLFGLSSRSVHAAEGSAPYATEEHTITRTDFRANGGTLTDLTGGGISHNGYGGLLVPFDADNISFKTKFDLDSAASKDSGGDGVDCREVYSFTKGFTAGQSGEIPRPGNAASGGVFITLQNRTDTANPNRATFAFNHSSNTDGSYKNAAIKTVTVDGAVNKDILLSLVAGEGNNYTFTVTDAETNAVLKTEQVELPKDVFSNEQGETYLSVSNYAGDGKTMDPIAYLYSMKAMTVETEVGTADVKPFFGNLSSVEGGGYKLAAHGGLNLPLAGHSVAIHTRYNLVSKKEVSGGGTGIDGWFTYSFTKQAVTADNQIPNGAGNGTGLYVQISNVSGTTAPNCSQIYIAQNTGSGNKAVAFSGGEFVDNALDKDIVITLTKRQNGTYSLAFLYESGIAIKTYDGLQLDESAFLNEDGQTYLSHAIYTADGAEFRPYVQVSSVEARLYDASTAQITGAEGPYNFHVGTAHTPEVTVSLGGKTLVKDTDYTVSYDNNTEVGTANVTVAFKGLYRGTAKTTFEIVDPCASGHGHESVTPGKEAQEATCTEKGKTAEMTCDVCGRVTKEQTDVAAKGHTEQVTKEAKEATCTEAGWTEEKKCSVCQETLQASEPLAAKGHTEQVTKEAKEATCGEAGWTEEKKCSVCNETIQESEEIPATGQHTFENGVCTVCGAEEPDEPDEPDNPDTPDNPDNPDTPDDPNEPADAGDEEKGCGGTIAIQGSALLVLTLAAVLVVVLKKTKSRKE